MERSRHGFLEWLANKVGFSPYRSSSGRACAGMEGSTAPGCNCRAPIRLTGDWKEGVIVRSELPHAQVCRKKLLDPRHFWLANGLTLPTVASLLRHTSATLMEGVLSPLTTRHNQFRTYESEFGASTPEILEFISPTATLALSFPHPSPRQSHHGPPPRKPPQPCSAPPSPRSCQWRAPPTPCLTCGSPPMPRADGASFDQ